MTFIPSFSVAFIFLHILQIAKSIFHLFDLGYFLDSLCVCKYAKVTYGERILKQ